ncbi:MAG: S9 family peptidase [Chitinophagales bacterium]|nr:S9 family peptidase [Chitinophagaceae bacterium]MCB9065633.1 S9 family peptidase [Chitinophagales bacterium]
MKNLILPVLLCIGITSAAQDVMTPELLWSLKRVGVQGISDDGRTVYYSARQYDWTNETSTSNQYSLNIGTGEKNKVELPTGHSIVQRDKNGWYARNGKVLYHSNDKGKNWRGIYDGIPEDADNLSVSPDGTRIMFSREVQVKTMLGKDKYADLPNTTVQIYTDLNYRHWDTWEEGKYAHVFVASLKGGPIKDIMKDLPYDVPQKPFGGAEDMVWTPDSHGLVYVCKKKYGKEYAVSTNTDLYHYDISSGLTVNLTVGMNGYDMSPVFSPDGQRLAWTSMARDGYEADKNDIYVMDWSTSHNYKSNITSAWDGTVNGFIWSNDSKSIYFNAADKGTVQAFSVAVPASLMSKILPVVKIITKGKFDIGSIVGQAAGNNLIVKRHDMNHADEVYAVNANSGEMTKLTGENDNIYDNLKMSNTELRMVKTGTGEQMGVWVIYPPDFDPTKKYPTLLYCQGGPQSALSQFYSFRWNFQLMAANGYIVVAPNRHGMPGWGVKWNEDISKDWGGKPMRDYLAAIDEVAKEKYVDKDRLGCIGASYGGYSVFMLAGIHEGRFKSFIAHDGLFDLKSWYGTTEELWFANFDLGGPYWSKNLPASYLKYDPSKLVSKWNTPIMIIQGGLDFRVGIEQGLEAFQAAQLQGVKSKLLYFPNENHWVLHAQNGIAWHREFFSWLEETIK